MAKNPKAHNTTGHRGGLGTVYRVGDPRLAGMGSPPSDPEWQAANPGAGRMQMPAQLVGVDELDDEHRPPESKWVLKPAADRRGVAVELDEPEPAPSET